MAYGSIGAPFQGNSIEVTYTGLFFGEIFLITEPVALGYYIIQALMINLGFSVTAGIIWMVLFAARKDLGYQIAKSLFHSSMGEVDESKMAQYFINAIKMYDKYLRRTLNLEINNVKKIYSKILSDININTERINRRDI
jgi:hypothetical protein